MGNISTSINLFCAQNLSKYFLEKNAFHGDVTADVTETKADQTTYIFSDLSFYGVNNFTKGAS